MGEDKQKCSGMPLMVGWVRCGVGGKYGSTSEALLRFVDPSPLAFYLCDVSHAECQNRVRLP